MPLFPFAQFEVAGRLGIADGRYLVRNEGRGTDDVLVISSLQAPRRGRRRRSRRARAAGHSADADSLPANRATIVRTKPFDGPSDAGEWLERMRRDADARDEFTDAARSLLNVALHAHRAAAMDPYVAELGPQGASVTRLGFGDGDELAEGRWREAIEAPPDPGPRRRRAEALRPQERLAAVLADRDRVGAGETLILRARLDLDNSRRREAALQLEPAIRAVLAEVSAQPDTDQANDLKLLESQLQQVVHAAREALSGDLPPELEAVVADTLAVAERILRRRRILGDQGV
jgi:hypothetical protein